MNSARHTRRAIREVKATLRVSAAPTPARKRTRCSECLGALAHRLSQPLTALHGSIELALLGPPDAARYRSELEQSLGIAQQAVRMIVELREMLEAINPHPGIQRIPLGTLAREAMEEVRCLADSRGVRMELKSPREVAAWGDRERLREIVLKTFFQGLELVEEKSEVRINVRGRQTTAFLTVSFHGAKPSACGVRRRPATPGQLFASATQLHCLEWVVLQSLAQSMGGDLLLKSGRNRELRLSIQLPRAV